MFISNNHTDHSGELLFAFESIRAKEPKLRVLCGPEVELKLKTHRLDELRSTTYTPVSIFLMALNTLTGVNALFAAALSNPAVFYQGLDFGWKGNLGVRRKIISRSSEE